MSRWKIMSGVVLVFIVGVLAGSVGTQAFFRHRFPPPPPDPKMRTLFLLERLSKDLALSENQKNQVRIILEQTEERLHQHFQKEQPEIKGIIDDGFSRIGNELNEDQKKKLEHVRQRLERHR